MELILIRHAATERLVTRDGAPADPPLTRPAGPDQAEAVADWLQAAVSDTERCVDQIVSSPARRARETAAPLASRVGLEPELDARLREFDSDASVYIPHEEARANDPEAYRKRIDRYRVDPRLAEMSPRVCASLDEWAARYPGGCVAVFCHGSVINLWACHVLGLEPHLFFAPEYASAHRFQIARDGRRGITSLNETAYLRA